MTPIESSVEYQDTTKVVFAKDQLEYIPLPAQVTRDGLVITEWKLDEEERKRILEGENIRLFIWTYRQPLQPVMLQVTKEVE